MGISRREAPQGRLDHAAAQDTWNLFRSGAFMGGQIGRDECAREPTRSAFAPAAGPLSRLRRPARSRASRRTHAPRARHPGGAARLRRSACAWCAAPPGSACTRSTGSSGGATGRPSCARSCACRTELDINTDTDLLERIIPSDMRAAFRAKLQASLAPESGGDYEDEHRITRFDGIDRLDPAARQDLLRRGPGGAARHALDRADRRHHRPQARRGGERAACLHRALIE